MLDMLLSIEAFTTLLALVGGIWGLIQKYKAYKARRSQKEAQEKAEEQRQELQKTINALKTYHEAEITDLNDKLDAATAIARDELALLRGEIAKLIDMMLSGEQLELTAEGGDVKVTGSAGEVVIKEKTLNRVVEATQGMKYKRGLGGKLKKVTL